MCSLKAILSVVLAGLAAPTAIAQEYIVSVLGRDQSGSTVLVDVNLNDSTQLMSAPVSSIRGAAMASDITGTTWVISDLFEGGDLFPLAQFDRTDRTWDVPTVRHG